MADWSDIEFSASPSRARKAKDFLPILSDLLVLWDFLSCVAAGDAALALYAHYVVVKPLDFSSSGPFWRDIVFGSLIAALVLRTPSDGINLRLLSTFRLIITAERKCAMAFGVLITVGLVTRSTGDLARLWLVSWLFIFAGMVGCTRWAVGAYLKRLSGRGEFREAVAIIGAAGVRERMAARISSEADIVGLYGTTACTEGIVSDQDDEFTQLLAIGRQGGLDSVIVAVDQTYDADTAHMIERLKAMPVQVAVCPEHAWTADSVSQTRLLGGIAMTVVADRPIKQWDLLLKTVIDKTGAMTLIFLLAPLLIGIAMAVAASSPGPIIFRQRRRGWSGRDFVIFKFRTMLAEQSEQSYQTTRCDPRCTPIGQLLRKCSLDELPQLWNVLRGEMSLVGPRPHAEALHDLDRAGREIVAEYAQRHRVKPGLTGWAQINGARGATTSLVQLQRRVIYDLYYIENWSLWLDMKILARTPFCLTGENAF